MSVIIACFNSAEVIERCLQSLRNQSTERNFEIMVVDSSTDGTAGLVEEKFPEVRLYRFAERKFCGDARNFGISVARGDVIALIDADCTADGRWIDEILKAHRSPVLAVGGSIGNAGPCSSVGWAAYFCEFSQWMPNLPARWLDDVAGANMSYKRKVFEEVGAFIEGTYCSDTHFHWRLRRRGHRLRFVPSIRIWHHSINCLGKFLGHEFEHGRCFGRVRAEHQNFSGLQRVAYAALSWLIPLRLFLRVALSNVRSRVYLAQFLKSSPLVLLGLACWAFGECAGYVGDRKNEKGSSGVDDFCYSTSSHHV